MTKYVNNTTGAKLTQRLILLNVVCEFIDCKVSYSAREIIYVMCRATRGHVTAGTGRLGVRFYQVTPNAPFQQRL